MRPTSVSIIWKTRTTGVNSSFISLLIITLYTHLREYLPSTQTTKPNIPNQTAAQVFAAGIINRLSLIITFWGEQAISGGRVRNYKEYADQKLREGTKYQKVAFVMLDARNIRLKVLCCKLFPKRIGQYRILIK